MKVVHLATTLSGGAGIAAGRIHQALANGSIDSRVVVAHTEQPSGAVATAGRHSPFIALRALRRLGLYRCPRDRILRKIKALQPKLPSPQQLEVCSPPFSDRTPETHPWVRQADVVHLHWTSGLVDWPRLTSLAGRKIVVTLHDQEPYFGLVHYARDLEQNPAIRSLESYCRNLKKTVTAKLCPTVAGNSSWNTQQAEVSTFYPPATVFETIPYPLDSGTYCPGDQESARARLGISSEVRVVGFASDLVTNPRKGMSVLFQALSALPLSLKNRTTLLSFGRTQDDSLSQTAVIPWHHVGPVHEPERQADLYRAMDIMVVPSLAEAFGQTAIEALACGLPVVASRCGGLVDAVADGHDGLLAPAGDSARLGEAIRTLLEDDNKRREFGHYGRRKVQRQHAPQLIANRYIDLYESR